jgi:hypothetical protein
MLASLRVGVRTSCVHTRTHNLTTFYFERFVQTTYKECPLAVCDTMMRFRGLKNYTQDNLLHFFVLNSKRF